MLINEPLAFYSAFEDKIILWLAESYEYTAGLHVPHRQDPPEHHLE